MVKRTHRTEEAYSGKYVTIKGKLHTLVPEKDRGHCEGCALYNENCPTTATKLCTQGFILKKVNI